MMKKINWSQAVTDQLSRQPIQYDELSGIQELKSEDIKYDFNFIIPVRGREQFAKPMLNSFKRAVDNTDLKITYTIVEHNQIPEHQEFCNNQNINYLFVQDIEGGMFNKCLAFNYAACFGHKSSYLILHDIDCLIQSDFFNKLQDNIKNKNAKAIQCFQKRRVLYLNEYITQKIISGITSEDELNESMPEIIPGTPGAPGGSICIERELFFKVGGYDPLLFAGWSPEDRFFWDKIETLETVYLCNDPAIELFHMHHPTHNGTNPYVYDMLSHHNSFLKSTEQEKQNFIEACAQNIKKYE